MQRPLCEDNDPDLWFDPGRFKEAIALCKQCPLLDKCAELGKNEEYGTWGGTTPHQRGYTHEEDGAYLEEADTKP